MKQIQAVALMLVFCQFSTVKIAVEIILSMDKKRISSILLRKSSNAAFADHSL